MSIYWTWSYPWEAQRDPAAMDNRFSTMTEVRNVAVAGLRDAGMERGAISCKASPERWSCSTAPRSAFQQIAGEATGHPVAVFQRIDQAGYKLPIDERILADTDTLMVFGLDHLLRRAGSRAGGDRSHPRMAEARGHMPVARAASRRGLHRRFEAASDGISPSRRRAGAAPAAVRPVHALTDESARRSRAQHLWASSRPGRRHEGDRAAYRIPRPRQAWAARQRHRRSISIRTCRTTN